MAGRFGFRAAPGGANPGPEHAGAGVGVAYLSHHQSTWDRVAASVATEPGGPIAGCGAGVGVDRHANVGSGNARADGDHGSCWLVAGADRGHGELVVAGW